MRAIVNASPMPPTPFDPAPSAPAWPLPIEWLPAAGRAEQLIVLLHGWAQEPSVFLPLAQALRLQFPQAAVLAPQAPDPADAGRSGHQWYSIEGLEDVAAWRARVMGCVASLARWLRAQQQRLGVSPAATALGGFSQGGVIALHAVAQHDGLAGRVLAFGARMVDLPRQAPQLSTLHLFHGSRDRIFDVAQARALLQQLGALQGDATLDIAEGIGHELHPAMIDCALHRLTHHIPQRTWREALGAAPAAARTPGDAED